MMYNSIFSLGTCGLFAHSANIFSRAAWFGTTFLRISVFRTVYGGQLSKANIWRNYFCLRYFVKMNDILKIGYHGSQWGVYYRVPQVMGAGCS